jgi:hypothetical protein
LIDLWWWWGGGGVGFGGGIGGSDVDVILALKYINFSGAENTENLSLG